MKNFLKILFSAVLFVKLASAQTGQWQDSAVNIDAGQLRIISSFYHDDNGEKKLIMGLHFKMKSGWKIYGQGSEGVGMVPSVTFFDSKNYKDHKIIWPTPIKQEEKIGETVLKYTIYKDEVILPIEINLEDNLKESELNFRLNYSLCSDVCVPATSDFNIKVENNIDENILDSIQIFLPSKQLNAMNPKLVGENKLINDIQETKNIDLQEREMSSITLIAGFMFAFIGGLILNIMPCVLPVLGVKLISIVSHRDTEISRIRMAFFATILGIFSCFILFALTSVLLAKTGHVFNWGLQFQNPYFLIFLVTVLVFFCANMLGFFEINFSNFVANFFNKKIEDNYREKNIFIPNFLSGILAVLIATPCSAPFLGAAISFSITQTSLIIFFIFLAMAFGFALPYFILIFWPKAIYLLPKSGKWTYKVKNIMAGFLVATIIWLVYVLSGNLGFQLAIIIAIISVLILICFKMKYKFFQFLSIFTLTILIFSIPARFKEREIAIIHRSDRVWQEFDVSKINDYVNEGKVVVVDVTADWCLTCKFNKYRVLRDESVVARLNGDDIIAMRADITKPDQSVMDFVNSHNRYAIPFNAVFGPNATGGLLANELLNKEELLKLIDQASKK